MSTKLKQTCQRRLLMLEQARMLGWHHALHQLIARVLYMFSKNHRVNVAHMQISTADAGCTDARHMHTSWQHGISGGRAEEAFLAQNYLCSKAWLQLGPSCQSPYNFAMSNTCGISTMLMRMCCARLQGSSRSSSDATTRGKDLTGGELTWFPP